MKKNTITDLQMFFADIEIKEASPQFHKFECHAAGGIVHCSAPAMCNEDCEKYDAIMIRPTESWGLYF